MAKHTKHHMMEEQSGMSRQLGEEREEGMETEKLSSACTNTDSPSRVKQRSSTLSRDGFHSPNHDVSSLLGANTRRGVDESQFYLHMSAHTPKHLNPALTISGLIKKQPVRQYFLNLTAAHSLR